MNSAPLTCAGLISSRGVLCESAGVGNFGSGGREDVKVHDFGRSARVAPA